MGTRNLVAVQIDGKATSERRKSIAGGWLPCGGMNGNKQFGREALIFASFRCIIGVKNRNRR